MKDDEKNLAVIECVYCGERGGRAYVTGGWWDLPRGWFQQGDNYACSRSCAEAWEARRAEEETEKKRSID